jgi:hypothetical protein
MKSIYFFLLATFTSVMAMAQDASGKLDVNINTDNGGGSWFTSPWVWVAGAAIFILLLVALTSGGGSRRVSNTTVERTTTGGSGDRVTTTRTTTSDDDLV